MHTNEEAKQRSILLLKGGLGNQLFQIGAALLSSTTSGRAIELCTDAYGFDRKREPHSVRLFPELLRASRFCALSALPFTLDRVARNPVFSPLVLSDSNSKDILSNRRGWGIISGYFQQYDFSANCAKRLQDSLPGLCHEQQAFPLVVHIRRTDFLKIAALRAEYLNLIGSYYGPAIEDAADRCGKQTDILVVSDDTKGAIDDLKRALGASRFNFRAASTHGVWDDLYTLSSAEYLIGSNSTFAWWAARISSRSVTLPKTWIARELNKHPVAFDLRIPNAQYI